MWIEYIHKDRGKYYIILRIMKKRSAYYASRALDTESLDIKLSKAVGTRLIQLSISGELVVYAE